MPQRAGGVYRHGTSDRRHTRQLTFLVTREGSSRAYREIGIPDGHHPLTHHQNMAELMDKVAQINRYHVERPCPAGPRAGRKP